MTVLSDDSTKRAQRIWINRKALGRITERAARLYRPRAGRSADRNQITGASRRINSVQSIY